MNYKAVSTDIKPFINWIMTNDEPNKDFMIVNEIPKLKNGVYPVKILEGKLVPWSKNEMNQFKSEFSKISKIEETHLLRNDLKDLFIEIQFTNSLNESVVELQSYFNEKLASYNNLKF